MAQSASLYSKIRHFFRARAYDGDDVAVLEREGAWGRAIGVFSLCGKPAEVAVDVPDGSYASLLDGLPVEVRDGKLEDSGAPIVFLT